MKMIQFLNICILFYINLYKIKSDYYQEIETVKKTFPFIVSFSHDISDIERFKNIVYKKERLDLLERGETIATEFLQINKFIKRFRRRLSHLKLN